MESKIKDATDEFQKDATEIKDQMKMQLEAIEKETQAEIEKKNLRVLVVDLSKNIEKLENTEVTTGTPVGRSSGPMPTRMTPGARVQTETTPDRDDEDHLRSEDP